MADFCLPSARQTRTLISETSFLLLSAGWAFGLRVTLYIAIINDISRTSGVKSAVIESVVETRVMQTNTTIATRGVDNCLGLIVQCEDKVSALDRSQAPQTLFLSKKPLYNVLLSNESERFHLVKLYDMTILSEMVIPATYASKRLMAKGGEVPTIKN